MDELVIEITPEGVVRSLHTDKFPLTFLGNMSVERASNIVFNDNRQTWEVVIEHEGERAVFNDFDTYESARAFEVKWLNFCRKEGLNPAVGYGTMPASQVL